MIDNQRSCGAKVARFGSFYLKLDMYVVFHQNNSYLHLMDDEKPCSHHNDVDSTRDGVGSSCGDNEGLRPMATDFLCYFCFFNYGHQVI